MLLALDPGTDTGVAWCHDGERAKHTTWRLGADPDLRNIRLVDHLTDILRDQSCARLGYEEPFSGPFVQVAQSLFGQRAMIRYVATRLSIPVYGYTPTEIKQAIAGGRAGKDRVMGNVRLLGYQPANDHESDALALLLLMQTGTLPQEGARKAAAKHQRRKVVDLFAKSTRRRVAAK